MGKHKWRDIKHKSKPKISHSADRRNIVGAPLQKKQSHNNRKPTAR